MFHIQFRKPYLILSKLIWPPKNGHHEAYYFDIVENLYVFRAT